MQRSYRDAGSISGDVLQAQRGIVPARPFGPAFYYSAGIARAWENDVRRLRLYENET